MAMKTYLEETTFATYRDLKESVKKNVPACVKQVTVLQKKFFAN